MASGSSVAERSTWEHFAHGADIGIRGIGPTLEIAFEQAALALTAIVTDVPAVRPETAVAVECTAPAADLLFVDWLNALIHEMATRRMLFGAFAVSIDGPRLRATAWGEPGSSCPIASCLRTDRFRDWRRVSRRDAGGDQLCVRESPDHHASGASCVHDCRAVRGTDAAL